MAREWESSYANAVLLSGDLYSSSPAITKPDDPGFSFEFRPKAFDLGLTGRLLEDGKERYQERLAVECDIYDAYNLATDLRPKRIVAVDIHGNQT